MHYSFANGAYSHSLGVTRRKVVYVNPVCGCLTLSNYLGFAGSLSYRHTCNYRLDPLDARIRAAGLDVVDLYVSKRLRRFIDVNFAVDNLFNKGYFETQNYFESRLRQGDDLAERIHATPGYPFGVTIGLTFRLGEK